MGDAFDAFIDELDFDTLPDKPQRARVYDAPEPLHANCRCVLPEPELEPARPEPLRPVRMRRRRDTRFTAGVLLMSLGLGLLIGWGLG